MRNYNGLATRLSTALLIAGLAATALGTCSRKEIPRPLPSASESAARHAIVKSLDTARSMGKILFAANQTIGAPHDLYEKDLHTGKVTNLTNTPDADDLNPQLSPDGKYIVYASNQKTAKNPAGNYQIFRLTRATGIIDQLTAHDATDFDPVYTPNGNILYKSNAQDGYGDIWEMDGTGGNQRNLTPQMNRTEEWKPTPVGDNLVIFTSRHADDGSMSAQALANTDELMLLDTSQPGATPTRLTNNNWPDWYSETDPTRPGIIAFTSKKDANSPDTIYEMDITQNDPYRHRKQLTDPQKLPGDSSDCSWTPNGTLLFVNKQSDKYQAMALTPDGHYYAIEGMGGDVLSPVPLDNPKID